MKPFTTLTLLASIFVLFSTPSLRAIDSGSDGSDGALSYPAAAGVVFFDPVALGIDADGDHVFHFTTIDIPAGTTVRLRSNELGEGRPITWLASGDVTIAGTIDLNGSTGHGVNAAIRLPAQCGAGGYEGGLGEIGGAEPQTAGNGPGGGPASPGQRGGGGGHRLTGFVAQSTNPPSLGGVPYGNNFLLPLTGGSGGGGGSAVGVSVGAGGGGGGGAILIASSTSITFTAGSMIEAKGGNGGSAPSVSTYNGGGGAGGAVRLVADVIEGDTMIDVRGGFGIGNSTFNGGGAGYIRIEANSRTLLTTATLTPSATYGHPGPLTLPPSAPQVRVTQIGTNSVPASTTGSYTMPDVTVDESAPVTITLEANNIPLGTTVDVVLHAEDGTTVSLTSTPLAGTFATSTATAGPVTLQHGFSRLTVHANFTP